MTFLTERFEASDSAQGYDLGRADSQDDAMGLATLRPSHMRRLRRSRRRWASAGYGY